MTPMLITLAGEERPCTRRESEMVELMGAWNYLTIGERRKVLNQYPELLGFWATLVSGIVGIGAKVTKAIVSRVKARKAKASAKAGTPTAIPNQQEINASRVQAAKVAIAQKKVNTDAQNKNLLMIGIPIAAVGAFMLLKKKRK